MTSLPAAWYGFRDRGKVTPGAFADLVIFDPATVADTATFTSPVQSAEGIDLVMCNGRITWSHKAHTGARPGRVLSRDSKVAITTAEPS
jgi:N-acyl-D-amino-acid deacylase